MRSAVHTLRGRPGAVGHEQRGNRYGVVVSANRFSSSTRWVVVPTSASARSGLIRPELDLGGDLGRSVALCDAIESVDAEKRLGEMVGYVSTAEMQAIERALTLLLHLSRGQY